MLEPLSASFRYRHAIIGGGFKTIDELLARFPYLVGVRAVRASRVQLVKHAWFPSPARAGPWHGY
jgi:hypothetical protein